MHFPHIFFAVMCAVIYSYKCLAKYIHAGLQATMKNVLLQSFPLPPLKKKLISLDD